MIASLVVHHIAFIVLGRAGVPGVPAVYPGWSAGPLGLLLMYLTVHVDTFPPVFIDNKSLRRSNKTVEVKVFPIFFLLLMEGTGSGIPTCFLGFWNTYLLPGVFPCYLFHLFTQ